MNPKIKPSHAPGAPNPLTDDNKILDSGTLLGPRQELLIRHGGRIYRLRRTRLGKLILTA